jgi:aspartyl-tRNA(Asn)/glutamyl-tRNA(Gln) amidotransferase subunit B
VRPVGSKKLGVKTELKNMNSFRNVERALEFEIARQIKILENGEQVIQQTLLWDADKNEAVLMRSKEFAHDYRYFPEPDLVPLEVSADWLDEIKQSLPELPRARRKRLTVRYAIPEYDAEVLADTRELADYFEAVAASAGDPKSASNWIMGEVLRMLKDSKFDIATFPVKPVELGALIRLINDGTISGKMAKSVFDEMVQSGKPPDIIVQEKGLLQVSDTAELERHVQTVLRENPAEVEKYLQGKNQLFGFLVGQIMKATRGQANPKLVNEILKRELQKLRK